MGDNLREREGQFDFFLLFMIEGFKSRVNRPQTSQEIDIQSLFQRMKVQTMYKNVMCSHLSRVLASFTD